MSEIDELKRIKKEVSVINSEKYILWLEKFTKKNNSFYSDDWIHSMVKISDNDLSNVNKLESFYKLIEDYSKKNFINPSKCDFGNYYTINYNDNSYNIGVLNEHNILYFCKRFDNIKKGINLNDIINNEIQPGTLKTNYYINLLNDLIDESIDNNVSMEMIEDIVKIKKLKK